MLEVVGQYGKSERLCRKTVFFLCYLAETIHAWAIEAGLGHITKAHFSCHVH